MDNISIDSPLLTRTPLSNKRQLNKNNSKNILKYLANNQVENAQKSKIHEDFEEVFEIAEEFDFCETQINFDNNISIVEKRISDFSIKHPNNTKEKILDVKRRVSVPLKKFFE